MKLVILFAFTLFSCYCTAQVLTLQPTQHTKGWFLSGDNTNFLKLDSFLTANKKNLSYTKDESIWMYKDFNQESTITIYRDTVHSGYLIKHSGRFLSFDNALAHVFPSIGYYQDALAITPNPYIQSNYIRKAGRNFMATGVLGIVTPLVAIIPLVATRSSRPGQLVASGIYIVGGFSALVTYFSAAKNLTLAGKTRFR